jgi:hypothetical protein
MRKDQYQVGDKEGVGYGAKKLTYKRSELLECQSQGLGGEGSGIFLPKWPLAHGALWVPPTEQR